MVFWTKPELTAIFCARRRWQEEDKKGIRGTHGGFDSKIVLSETRDECSECSEGLYRIRILVDESKVVDAIPVSLRLNLISPMMQCNVGLLKESTLGSGGRTGAGARSTVARKIGLHDPKHRGKGGRTARKNGTGIFAPGAASRAGTISADRRRGTKIGIFSLSPPERQKVCSAGGLIGGRIARETGQARALGLKHKQNSTGIFGLSSAQRGDILKARHLRNFLKTVAWG